MVRDAMEGPQWAYAWSVWTSDLEEAAFVRCFGRPFCGMEWDLGAVLSSCPRESCVSPAIEETHPVSAEPSGQLGADLTPLHSLEWGLVFIEATTLGQTESVTAGKTSSPPSSTKASRGRLPEEQLKLGKRLIVCGVRPFRRWTEGAGKTANPASWVESQFTGIKC